MKKRAMSFLALLLTLTLALTATAIAADGLITAEAAKLAALTHAGVLEKDATIVRVKLDKDDGPLEYEVEFYAGGVEYDYEIDAASGQVTGYDSDLETLNLPVQNADGLISQEAAKAAAFAHAKVEEAAATLVLAQLSYDDGRWEYEIEFTAGHTEYDYEIDALTGGVLAFDRDMESIPPLASSPAGDIGAEKAKQIALAHASLSADGVRELEAELDKDDGVSKYEVEFKAGGKEYSYDIDSATGEILKSKVENDD